MKLNHLRNIQAALLKIAITWEDYSKAHPKTRKTPTDPLFTKPGKGDPHQVQEKPKHQEKMDAAEAMAKESPRVKATRKTKSQLESPEYNFARESKFTNKGEDLANSARHKRNEWKGLEQSEIDGTAEKLITRDNLLKLEPPDFMGTVDKNPGTMLSSLAMYVALKRFPPDPPGVSKRPREDHEISRSGQNQPDGKDLTVGEHKKQIRKEYLETFREISKKAQEIAASEIDPDKAIAQLRGVVGEKIEALRKKDPYHPMGNPLAHFYNKVLSSYARSRNAVKQSLLDFAGAVHKNYGGDESKLTLSESLKENKDKVVSHVKDILDGQTLNESFGIESSNGKRKAFNPAEAYVDHAERKGPDSGFKTVKQQTNYLMEGAGMRGFQWGNAVSDTEREHHLKYVSEAFKDLTDVLGLPEKMGSFNGRLGLAIGARGHGRALAHYEPSMAVINLTRKSGVGSLAHEYFHFWDNVMGKLVGAPAGKHGSFLSTHAETRNNNWYTRDRMPAPDAPKPPDDDKVKVQAAMAEIFPHIAEFRSRMRKTDVFREMSNDRKKYWWSTHEVMARSFERYIDYKLKQKGRLNTYLAGVSDHPLWPSDEEVKKMAPVFDKIFATFAASTLKTAFMRKTR